MPTFRQLNFDGKLKEAVVELWNHARHHSGKRLLVGSCRVFRESRAIFFFLVRETEVDGSCVGDCDHPVGGGLLQRVPRIGIFRAVDFFNGRVALPDRQLSIQAKPAPA